MIKSFINFHRELSEGEYEVLSQDMEEEHNLLKDKERTHYMIKPVEVL